MRSYSAFNIDLSAVSSISSIMKEVGFVDIVERKFPIPFGRWARDKDLKELGMFMFAYIEKALQGLVSKPFQLGLGWTSEATDQHLAELKGKLLKEGSREHQMFFTITVIHGRRP
jgi:hypothetical protein